VPSFCPQSYGHGALSSGGYFLATDFLNLRSTSKKKSSGLSFAQKLERLHATAAPVPDGHSSPQFGFPVPTCCGNTEQPNDFTSSWSDFYANQRLRAIAKSSEKANGKDEELSKMIEKVASAVVPRLLRDGHLKSHYGTPIAPVVVHGDLWSGNHGTGSIGGGGIEEVVYDPSSTYAHSEFDLGIMKMFGGFSGVLEEYHALKPKDLPKEEYDDRVALYEL
jgi:fructosamine-3-kinase